MVGVRPDLARQGDCAGLANGGSGRLEQVGAGVGVVEARGLDQAVEDGGGLGAALGAVAVEVLPADDRAAARSAALLSSGTRGL